MSANDLEGYLNECIASGWPVPIVTLREILRHLRQAAKMREALEQIRNSNISPYYEYRDGVWKCIECDVLSGQPHTESCAITKVNKALEETK